MAPGDHMKREAMARHQAASDAFAQLMQQLFDERDAAIQAFVDEMERHRDGTE